MTFIKKRVDVAYAFIYRAEDKKVLMVNNKGSGWSLPGGAVELGETLEEAVIRETREETGLDVEAGQIVAVNEAVFQEKGHHALFITFAAEIIGGGCAVQDSEEILEVQWIEVQKASKLLMGRMGNLEALLQSSALYTYQGIV
ncbi:NUDIX hydrolase [Planococcus shixiaomingii]|uniref:NUDIX hydrolase n=1 Tax=Planococcus shixiaomingii TaxID=3058393 RepID=UPI0026335785|nr:NUDIX hydrolase [Planococcus sp. N022]WKA54997.1 NUDIX hydrolase [Planococcus sp. N022]